MKLRLFPGLCCPLGPRVRPYCWVLEISSLGVAAGADKAKSPPPSAVTLSKQSRC